MSAKRTILISGGGVGGLSLAYWLNQHGFDTTLVERKPSLSTNGYGIDVRGAGFDVADRMGIGEAIWDARLTMESMSYVDDDGRIQVTVKTEQLSAEHDIEIRRGDMNRLLYALSSDDVDYVFDDSITSLTQHDDGVDVTFQRGEPRTYDLVIGADGLHSNVRKLVFGAEAEFVRHLGYYIAIYAVDEYRPPEGQENATVLHNSPGKLAGLYNARGSTYGVFIFASDPIAYDYDDEDQQKRILEERFADGAWETPDLLKAMRKSTDFFFDEVSQTHMQPWSRGRIVLAGDAAHCGSPLSGQGTMLALVGAYILAGELASAGFDHRAAFGRYEDLMREFAEKNQALAHDAAALMAPPTRIRIWLRDQMLGLLPHLPGRHLFGKQLENASRAVHLEDYPRMNTQEAG